MENLNNKSAANVLWFLNELASYESKDIEDDDFEVGCNDDQFCTVSIVDLAEDAAAIISKLTNEAARADEPKWISVNLGLPRKSGAYWTFNGDDDKASVIQQRVQMYDHDHKEFNSWTVTHW